MKTGPLGGETWWFLLRISFIFHFSLFIFHCPAPAQTQKAQALYSEGIRLFGERKTSEALPYLEQAIKESPDYADAYLKAAQFYTLLRQPERALSLYRALLLRQPTGGAAATASLSAGELLLKQGRYAEAQPLLEQAQTLGVAPGAKGRLERQIETAKFGAQAITKPLNVAPKPLAGVLNTTPSQYFPVLTADEQTLVFTALQPDGQEDLLVSYQKAGQWTAPESLSPFINSATFNEGTASLSADGRLLVFTACQNRSGYGGCDLYQSRKEGEQWSAPENLGASVNTSSYESQPALSADGRRLYFVSDRKGGIGRRDVWRSDRQANGLWGPATNVGAPINTPGNEASPFIHANGQTLFFASDGLPGMGGYDLFVSDSSVTSVGWSKPENLGYPINTADDQASLFVGASGRRAYYSYEERIEGVSQKSRIYAFDLPETLRSRIRPVHYVAGRITDGRSNRPLAATVEVLALGTGQLIGRVRADSLTGRYGVVLPAGGEYALYVSKPGFLFKSVSFNVAANDVTASAVASTSRSVGAVAPTPEPPANVAGSARTLDVALAAVGTGRETLNNIFFETGRYDLAEKSRLELTRLVTFLRDNPTVALEISGHTDNQGDAAANLALSKKRAQAVVTYLTGAGVATARLRAVGYGETRPVAANTTDEGRQQNRRIDWRVM